MAPRYCSWWNEDGVLKPEGGWAPVHVEAICRVWTLRHTDIRVSRILPRVYFALIEVAQRRCQARRPTHYGPAEVCRLTGLADNDRNRGWVRRAVTGLTEAGLVAYRGKRLHIATRFPDVGISEMAGAIKRSARRVPVPRRMLRRLAASGRADMATLLGVLIRCVHNHREIIRRAGRLQVSWIASVFGLSRSAVIAAKKRLLADRVISEQTTPQWEMNKTGWGVRTVVNVDWKPADDGAASAQNSAPPRSTSERPCLDQHLSSSAKRERHQQPGRSRHRPVGVLKSSRKQPASPRLSRIVAEDLGSLDRLSALFRERTGRRGGSGDRDFLDHVAAAVRARTRGRDATAFFAWTQHHPDRVRAFITEDEEETARRWILREQRGIEPDGPRLSAPAPPAPPAPAASDNRSEGWTDDEQVVIACRQVARRQRGGDAFALARRAKGWTRDRWAAACLSFERKRAGQHVRVDREAEYPVFTD